MSMLTVQNLPRSGFPPVFALACFFLIGFLAPLHAQTPPAPSSPQPPPSSPPATTPSVSTPVPQSSSPAPAQDAKPSAEMTQDSAPYESTATFKVPVNLVLVHVVVRDAAGHVVSNLKKDDFQLFDNRKIQLVTHFSVETPPAPKHFTPEAKAANELEGTVKPEAAVALPSRFVALLFDDVHLSIEDLTRARLAAMRFLSSVVQPSDRVALFTVSGLDQVDFTDDHDQLKQKLGVLIPRDVTAADATGNTSCPTMNAYEADQIANHTDPVALSIATADALACAFSNDPKMNMAAQNLATTSAYSMVTANYVLTDYSFRRLQEIVRRMSVLPGQRSIVLVSPGFLFPGHELDLSDIIDKATRANVMINGLDARGLYTTDDGQDISQPFSGSLAAAGPKSTYYMQAQLMQDDILAELADATGAFFFHNSNDLDAGFRLAAAAPEVSYLLGFSPVSLKYDGKFHELKVTLAGKQKYSIQARRGYYAPKRSNDPAEAAKEQIEEAVFSQEEIHDLPAELHTQYYRTSSSDAQISVLTRLNVSRLQFRKADGRNNNNLTIVAALFDRNGNFIKGDEKTITLHLREATLERLTHTGMTIKSDFDVKPGAYLVRMVVRDSESAMLAAENGMVDIPY